MTNERTNDRPNDRTDERTDDRTKDRANDKHGEGETPRRLSDEEPAGPDSAAGASIASSMASDADEKSKAAAAEAEKFRNDYLYLRAEFDNFKKQVIKERSDLRKYGSERVFADVVNVLDILETALASEVTPESLANFRKGIEMTAAELRNVLQKHGVTDVPSEGKPFDPMVHEALSSEESDSVPPGTVTRVSKKPYKLHDRVFRPGQVVVAKPPGK